MLKKTEEVGNIPEATIETNLLDRKVLTVQEIRPLSHHWYFAHTSRNPHHQLLYHSLHHSLHLLEFEL